MGISVKRKITCGLLFSDEKATFLHQLRGALLRKEYSIQNFSMFSMSLVVCGIKKLPRWHIAPVLLVTHSYSIVLKYFKYSYTKQQVPFHCDLQVIYSPLKAGLMILKIYIIKNKDFFFTLMWPLIWPRSYLKMFSRELTWLTVTFIRTSFSLLNLCYSLLRLLVGDIKSFCLLLVVK